MKHRIVVLGAGYAGANAAGRLARRLHRDDVEITLVNADPDFVERVRMHQLASGQDLPRRVLGDIFGHRGVRVSAARVTAVDVDRHTVDLARPQGAETLGYDSLVYALGSTVADHGVPGAAEHSYNVAGKDAALRLRARLAALPPGGRVLVVGGGLTGIETATEIAESRRDLAVAIAARGRVGGWLGDKAQRHLRATLDRLGVSVRDHTLVTRVDSRGAVAGALADTGVSGGDGTIPADVTVWTAGFAVHPIAAATTLTVSDTGRIVVDGTMRSVSHPDVYAIGDAAVAAGAGGRPLRMSCASGIPMAWVAADALAARLTGRKVPETTIGYTIQCISPGRADGIIQRVTPDDRATSTAVTGRTAARLKEFVCAGAAWSVAHPTVLPRRRHLVAARTAPGVVTR
ncbi:NAD(P)/FAD-dependent oxidoreductase [Rhodococcus zopfii]|uniref:NAD(P)/FAD-dependent oxidoreductase n=1 Tax=Rhodococcus zopfii TaxID=43772 RepID=UPI000932940F|nr:FAD-dependent oxidoreductase [Rhodococcus zopfii]